MANNLAHGFAALNGGTTGGSGGKIVRVSTGAQLQAAIDGATGASAPLTILIEGKITPQNSGTSVIEIAGRSNISLIGAGAGAEFDGIGIRVSGGSSNLIIQNLKIHDVNTGPRDAIGIEGPSHNIWIDHNELYSSLSAQKDYYDGLLDIKRGAEYITVSNNYIHDHHKASLVGYSDTDAGARYVTYDHNVFRNIGSRTPSVRDGYVHVYNNYYENVSESAINLRMGAVGLIENNVFKQVRNPIVGIDSARPGRWDLRGNVMVDVTWSAIGSNEASARDGRSTGRYDVPYIYSLDDAARIEAENLARAGVGHLDADPDPSVPTDPVQSGPDPSAPEPDVPGPSKHPDPVKPLPGGAELLTGTAGADRLEGLSGRDTLHGGAGGDWLAGGDGRDLLFGEAGADTLDGGRGDDRLDGGIGADRLLGGAGRDTLLGGGGNDTLDGGSGGDSLAGGAGDDFYIVDGTQDRVSEAPGEGSDTVQSSVSFVLHPNVETLLLGGTRNIDGTGNALANRIVGNGGNNLIAGGGGDDTLTGGGGRDVFVLVRGQGGHLTVTDFRPGEDRILLGGYAAGDVRVTQDAAGTTLTLPDATIELRGTHAAAGVSGWLTVR